MRQQDGCTLLSRPKQSESVRHASLCSKKQLSPAFAFAGQAGVPITPKQSYYYLQRLLSSTVALKLWNFKLKIMYLISHCPSQIFIGEHDLQLYQGTKIFLQTRLKIKTIPDASQVAWQLVRDWKLLELPPHPEYWNVLHFPLAES